MTEQTQETTATEVVTETVTTDKTYTHDELERILGERLNRERKKYEGFDDLKAKAQRLDEIEEANKTELQKLQDAKSKLEDELNQERATRKRDRLVQSIEKVATKAGFLDPEDAVMALETSLSSQMDAKGDIEAKVVQKAIDDLAKRKPHLVGTRYGSFDGGQRGTRDINNPDEQFGQLVADKLRR